MSMRTRAGSLLGNLKTGLAQWAIPVLSPRSFLVRSTSWGVGDQEMSTWSTPGQRTRPHQVSDFSGHDCLAEGLLVESYYCSDIRRMSVLLIVSSSSGALSIPLEDCESLSERDLRVAGRFFAPSLFRKEVFLDLRTMYAPVAL